MSTRTYFVSIRSIDPIRQAVASNDASLVEAVMTRYANEQRDESGELEIDDQVLDEFRDEVEGMILCPSPPEEEPGTWNSVIELLAQHFQLDPDDNLPFNEGWKHYFVWERYRAMLDGHIAPECDKSLEHLQVGRPLRGSHIDHDGCLFSWLTHDEVEKLYESLSKLDQSLTDVDEFQEFHDVLVQSLKIIKDRGAVLFMGAS
jgi:hypothetical protein